MAKFVTEREVEAGWSRWVQPVMRGYKLACCDCGLVHLLEFRALRRASGEVRGEWRAEMLDQRRYRVEFRARRDARSTGQVRRHRARRNGR